MKILIVTVAGSSTRFSKSVGYDVLKCLYHVNSFSESLLYQIINKHRGFDKYVIVGGYKYDELEKAVNNELTDCRDKIELVYNEHYVDLGSGYSLYCGMKKALEYNPSEIIFAEGDLFIDKESFTEVFNSDRSVVTVNNDPILANKAVAFYFDINNKIRYIYDTGHSSLKIDEPFLSIHNSGQIWKFSDKKLLNEVFENTDLKEWEGTNLVFVEKYFRQLNADRFEIIRFKDWINCNTVNDFKSIS